MRKAKNIAVSIKNNPLTFYFLVSGIVASALLYMFFINFAVRSAVSRKDTESSILALENKVSNLEYLYMEKQNSITMDSAKDFGLVEPANKVFISSDTKIAVSSALSFNDK